jgi:hypothetical protein
MGIAGEQPLPVLRIPSPVDLRLDDVPVDVDTSQFARPASAALALANVRFRRFDDRRRLVGRIG